MHCRRFHRSFCPHSMFDMWWAQASELLQGDGVWASVVSTIIFCQSDEIKFHLPHTYICITVRRSKMSSGHLEPAQANLPLPPTNPTSINPQPPLSLRPSPSPPHPAPPRRKIHPSPSEPTNPMTLTIDVTLPALPFPAPILHRATTPSVAVTRRVGNAITAPGERALGSGNPARWRREGGIGRGCGGGWWEW